MWIENILYQLKRIIMGKKPIRILALFDYSAHTGFATVSHNLVKEWRRIFGQSIFVDIVGVNYFGEDFKEGSNIRVISAKNKDVARDDFGRYVFMRSLTDIDYDLIFILQDLGVVIPMIPHLQKIYDDKKQKKQKLFKSIFYFPVDFALNPLLVKNLEFFDSLITYTEYGRKNVLNWNYDLRPKLKVIPHGHNIEHFYPLSKDETNAFRKEYYKENADKYIVGCVNRNQPRKDIPTTIFGFLEYWDKFNKNSLLYLHMHPKDPMGWNLRQVLSQTPLVEGKDYMFPPEEDYLKGASTEKMNKIYNSFDVFLTTATGGGWELTVTEAFGAMKPCIIPKHTSFEILGGKDSERAYYLNTLHPVVQTTDNIIRFQSDLYEIAERLKQVKGDLDNGDSMVLKNKTTNAYKFVESNGWRVIARQFADEIKRLS